MESSKSKVFLGCLGLFRDLIWQSQVTLCTDHSISRFQHVSVCFNPILYSLNSLSLHYYRRICPKFIRGTSALVPKCLKDRAEVFDEQCRSARTLRDWYLVPKCLSSFTSSSMNMTWNKISNNNDHKSYFKENILTRITQGDTHQVTRLQTVTENSVNEEYRS